MAAALTNTREERVLTLLHVLGPEAAEQVLACLDPQTTSLLRNRLKDVSASPPPLRKQTQVIDEFERFFSFALATPAGGLKLHQGDDPEDSEGVGDEQSTQPVYTLSGDALVDLEKMNMYQLSGALESEQPRTVALLLKVVSPKRVAQILGLLPEEKRENVVREMSRDPRAPEIILRRIASTIVERAISLPAEPRKNDDNVQRMVDVLRATEKSKRRQILKTLEAQDPAQAALINQALYQFDDLLNLEDAQIQKVLSRVDSSTLSTALFAADERLVDRIMNNLSKRARTALQEELSFRRNVSGSQLQASRQLMVQAIAESEQEAD
ncbi:FliG C-terminal domain-containing protein [Planctomicrobium sp. SH661]|uniref:FliG C-terminal domain-containing protein n=1 Tax=Planctomicrobium sp. SH661 TaxID=3448124 RepID=UPI003F5AF607